MMCTSRLLFTNRLDKTEIAKKRELYLICATLIILPIVGHLLQTLLSTMFWETMTLILLVRTTGGYLFPDFILPTISSINK